MKEIQLTRGYVALVDDEDYAMLSMKSWHANIQRGGRLVYAVCGQYDPIKKKTVGLYKMHRIIMGITDPSLQVDHISHNTLDNRKCNLRVCTNKENIKNRRPLPNKSSKFKGVYFNKKLSKWLVALKVDGKILYGGCFNDECEAATEYNRMAEIHHGEYAYLNTIL